MARKRHFHRRRQRQFCRSATLWAASVFIALLSLLGWHQAGALQGMAPRSCSWLVDPDFAGEPSSEYSQLNGDGVLDAPGTLARLVPALAGEAGAAIHNGDADRALRQLGRWLVSGEALSSQPFWVFCSTVGAGIAALVIASLVQRLGNTHRTAQK